MSNTDDTHLPTITTAVTDYHAGNITARDLEAALPKGDVADGQGTWRTLAGQVRTRLSDWMQEGLAAPGIDSLTRWLNEKVGANPAHQKLADDLKGLVDNHG